MSEKAKSKVKTKSFEKLMEELESLVGDLESGDLPLDKSLEKFEKGIEVYNNCVKKLKDAEEKITILTDSLEEKGFSD